MSNINQMFVEYEALSVKKNKLVRLVNKFKHATEAFEHHGKCHSLRYYAAQLKFSEEHYYNFMNKIKRHSHNNTLTANNLRANINVLLRCLTKLTTAEEEYNSALASFYCIKERLNLVNKQMKTLKDKIVKELSNHNIQSTEPTFLGDGHIYTTTSFPENDHPCTCTGDGPCTKDNCTCQKSSEDLGLITVQSQTPENIVPANTFIAMGEEYTGPDFNVVDHTALACQAPCHTIKNPDPYNIKD